MNPAILELLCHPRTHEPLERAEGDWLVTPSGERFPLQEGIPSFVSAATPGAHRFWAWVYNRVAFAYDWGVSVGWKLKLGGQPIVRATYLDKIRIEPGELVLETAVGTGTNLARLPGQARYVGLDISFNMLRRCRANLRRWRREADLVHGDAQYLPFRENAFEVVYHMGGMQFLTDPAQAMAEALRVAKPGGKIWLVDESYSIPQALKRTARARAARGEPFAPPGPGRVAALAGVAPLSAVDVHAEMLSGGELYLLFFRKA